MAVEDVTRWFKDPNVNWALRGRAFANQFAGRVEARRGVYAHLDHNASELPIYDRNGSGKVIVLGSAMALKYGKFLGGLPQRMLQNFDHFHRRRPDGSREDGIFPRVLACLFVLDLGARLPDQIRPLETAWNRSIRTELARRRLFHPEHSGKAESVNLARRITATELLEVIGPAAARLES